MSISPLSNLADTYLNSITNSAQNSGGGSSKSTNSSGVSGGLGADQNQLSPLAQLLSTLQQLQETNPTEYQQLTGQIATNLQTAASTAQSDGNTAEANQLNQLATDFSSASQSGQLPNIQDLAQAIQGGGHHHHHHHGGNEATSQNISSSSASSSNSSASSANLNPISIILNTLSSSGFSGS